MNYFEDGNFSSNSIPFTDNFAVPHQLKVTFAAVLTFTSLIGLLGNIGLIYILKRRPTSRLARHNALAVSLSVAASFMCLCTAMTIISLTSTQRMFGTTGCSAYVIAMGTCGLASICSMMAVAMERYNAISNIIYKYNTGSPVAGTKFCLFIALLWLYSLAWTIPPLFGWGKFSIDDSGSTCSVSYLSTSTSDKSYMLSLFVAGFLLPLGVLIFCYVTIFGLIRKHGLNLTCIVLPQQVKLNGRHRMKICSDIAKREIKVLKMSVRLVVAFNLVWMPYALVTLIGVFGGEELIGPHLQLIPALFAKLSPLINPIVYSYGQPDVQAFIKKHVFCQRNRSRVITI